MTIDINKFTVFVSEKESDDNIRNYSFDYHHTLNDIICDYCMSANIVYLNGNLLWEIYNDEINYNNKNYIYRKCFISSSIDIISEMIDYNFELITFSHTYKTIIKFDKIKKAFIFTEYTF